MAIVDTSAGTTKKILIDELAIALATTGAFTASITLGTPQASTSGTAIDFTGLPAGVQCIKVMLNGVSTNGVSDILIQLGDAGGVEATGYVGVCFGSATDISFTTGFGIIVSNATDAHSGTIELNLENSGTFTWSAKGGFAILGALTAGVSIAGYKALSAALDRVRITTVGGDTFDAGEINISYGS